MSEYQFFEFLALDRPLTASQRQQLSRLSSRARVTASSFTVHYDYGDFSGDPADLVGSLFDAHLHVASWGSRHVLLTVPARRLPLSVAQLYTTESVVTAWESGERTVVAVRLDPEDGYLEFARPLYFDDEAGSGVLHTVAQARDGLSDGDLRLLYVAWLVAVLRGDVEDDALEPPVPPGLADLDDALAAFAAFFELPATMIHAAAVAAADLTDPPEEQWWTPEAVEPWVARVPHQRLVDIVTGLVLDGDGDGDAVVDALRWQIRDDVRLDLGLQPTGTDGATPGQRTAGELLAREALLAQEAAVAASERHAEVARAERERRERAAAAEAKARQEGLTREGPAVWDRLDRLINPAKQSTYHEASAILSDLRDLATIRGGLGDFDAKLTELRSRNAGRRNLISILDAAGLRPASPRTQRQDAPADLDALVAAATIDCYSTQEAVWGFLTMLQDELHVPFTVELLGGPVVVTEIDMRGDETLVARCEHAGYHQLIDLLDLPAPDPQPDGWQWVQAYRHFSS